MVIKSTGRWYTVKDLDNQNHIQCTIKGKLRLKGLKSTNPVAAGDIVHFDYLDETLANDAVITDIEPRKNYIIRKSSNLSKQYHLIAANVDQAILMISLKNPKTPLEFIDRFLVSTQAYDIPAILLINKTDIYEEKEFAEMTRLMEIYSNIGYPCVDLSVKEKHHFEEVKKILQNKTSVIAGNSGVGKSSLLNTIDPSLDLKTKEVSESHKTGKHTTTFAEMHELPMGGYVIDTPGIRAFGIIEIERNELYHFFPEIFDASANCKFHNCLHTDEPKCNVKEKVQEGIISKERYKNYLSMLFEDQSKYRIS